MSEVILTLFPLFRPFLGFCCLFKRRICMINVAPKSRCEKLRIEHRIA